MAVRDSSSTVENMKNLANEWLDSLAVFGNEWLMCVIGRQFFIHPNGEANMTLGELIGLLEEYRDEHGEDCEVRLMTQQNWPFENRIAGVTSGAEMNEAEHDDPHEFADEHDVAEDAMVYIVEGGQLCYGSKRAWETCRDC